MYFYLPFKSSICFSARYGYGDRIKSMPIAMAQEGGELEYLHKNMGHCRSQCQSLKEVLSRKQAHDIFVICYIVYTSQVSRCLLRTTVRVNCELDTHSNNFR